MARSKRKRRHGSKKRRRYGSTKKSPEDLRGILISKDCENVTVVDKELFDKFLIGVYSKQLSADPSISLMLVTDRMFHKSAPGCWGFPHDPQSEQVADLYMNILRRAAIFMASDDRVNLNLSDAFKIMHSEDLSRWYKRWSNYPTSIVPKPVKGHVAFSSDMTGFEIDEAWFPQTVQPFVEQARSAGELPTAYDDFVGNVGVMVGRFMYPISELPTELEATTNFLNQVAEAIETAAQNPA